MRIAVMEGGGLMAAAVAVPRLSWSQPDNCPLLQKRNGHLSA